jgi:hypothetical protein
MQDEEKRDLRIENKVLRANIRDLEEQLHNAYKRIQELNESTERR